MNGQKRQINALIFSAKALLPKATSHFTLVAFDALKNSQLLGEKMKIFAFVTLVMTSTISCAQDKTIIENTFGCITPDAYKDAWSYLTNQEKQLFGRMFATGQCDLFEKGQKVILMDYKFMDYATVRRPGSSDKFIMYPSAFK